MGCTYTKIKDPKSRDGDGKVSEILSQNSSFTNYKKELECHTAPATRSVVEKCHLAMSMSAKEEQDVSSLHMFPPANLDESESEMVIPPYHAETSDLRQDKSDSNLSTVSQKSRTSSRLSSRLSNIFRIGKRSKLNIQEELSSDVDLRMECENEDDKSWDRPPSPSRQDYIKDTLKRANKRIKDLSQKVATEREIGEDQALELIDEILDRYEMSSEEEADDERSTSSSSSDGSVFFPTFNFRNVIRPKAAKGSRNFAAGAPDPAIIAQRIGDFEAEVEKLIDEQVTCTVTVDQRNRQLRPWGVRSRRLPSFSLQHPDRDTSSETDTENGKRYMYSKYFTNNVSRPQLTIQGLSTENDRLMQWMASQQRRDSEWR